ncbi:hypothetical protein J3E73DRAFT_392407 [Bipolaris maydis]|nr:hypothetical protein J3E73DRAFT_392407 [Bipolaris maydis]
MTTSNKYSVLFSGLIAFVILCFITRLVFQWLAALITDAILKYLVYSTTSPFGIFKWRLSAKDTMFPILFVCANGICKGWGAKAAKELSSQSASMLATNLILLLPRSNAVADILHISLRVGNIKTISGIAIFCCMGLISVTSLPIFRYYGYEIFRIIHVSCSTLICIFLWLYITLSNKMRRVQVIIAIYMWVVTYTHRNLLLIYCNFSRHPFMVVDLEAGFISQLLTQTLYRTRELRFNLRDFSIVVLFASKIGIIRHLADLLLEVINTILRKDNLLDAVTYKDTSVALRSGKIGRYLGSSIAKESLGVRPTLYRENIIDVYIYSNYDILNKAGNTVLYRRIGSQITKVKGRLDVGQIISDVLEI